MKKTAWTILVGLVFAGFLQHPALSEKTLKYPECEDNTEFNAILAEYQDRGNYEKALNAYRDLARRNAGRTLGALTSATVARMTSDLEERKAIYQSIIQNYPQSRFEITSKLALLDLNPSSFSADPLKSTEDLATSYGGPDLATIENHRSRAVTRIRKLPWEYQRGLVFIYTQLHEFRRANNDIRAAMKVALFLREAFPFLNVRDTEIDLREDYKLLRFGKSKGARELARVNPQYRLLRQASSCGPRPKLRIQLWTGPWEFEQVSLSGTNFYLDGRRITTDMEASTLIDKKYNDRDPYEVLTLSYRPDIKLTPGKHVFSGKINTNTWPKGPNLGGTEFSYEFRVTRGSDDEEDEREDGGDDD
jgi:hypothetical protein